MKEVIRQAISEALTALNVEEVDFDVDHPTDTHTKADYFSNVAMKCYRAFAEAVDSHVGEINLSAKYSSPRDVAEAIKSTLLDKKIADIESIEIAGPGFLNFHLSRDFFKEKITTARDADVNWGKNDSWQGKKVVVEYTSPNLFKPLHIGNLVGNIIGESLTRLFAFSGAEVKRINYPSDIGLTVAKAVWGLKETGGDATDIDALGIAYRTGNEAYENDESAKAAIIEINQALYAGEDTELLDLRAAGIATSKKKLAEICATLGTSFDTEIFESEVGDLGKEVVKQNTGSVFVESDGAVVYEGEKVGLHTRVFLSSKGLPTYEAKDLGNFVTKQKIYPEWDTSIVVTGNEQKEYFKVLYAAINELYPETTERNLEHIATGFLTLTTGKMSSRQGNVLTGEALLEDMEKAAKERAAESRTDDIETLASQIAVAALKYQILRQHVGGDMVFDKEASLSFEGDSGPYLQYTFARINSLLKKAAAAGVAPSSAKAPDTAYPVERLVYQFPEVVAKVVAERSPHTLAHYLTELAATFNAFYAQEKIADEKDEYAPYKAAVTEAVQHTLKNGLWCLGIEAPEKM